MSAYEDLFREILEELADEDGAIYTDMDSCIRTAMDMAVDWADRESLRLSKKQGNRRIYRLHIEYPEGMGPGDTIMVEKTITTFNGAVRTDRYPKKLPRERAYLTKQAAVERGREYTAMGLMWTLEESNPVTWPIRHTVVIDQPGPLEGDGYRDPQYEV